MQTKAWGDWLNRLVELVKEDPELLKATVGAINALAHLTKSQALKEHALTDYHIERTNDIRRKWEKLSE